MKIIIALAALTAAAFACGDGLSVQTDERGVHHVIVEMPISHHGSIVCELNGEIVKSERITRTDVDPFVRVNVRAGANCQPVFTPKNRHYEHPQRVADMEDSLLD